MMALVEHIACRAAVGLAAPDGIDHHQSVVGDDDVGIGAGPRRALDEAFPVMRAAGIDALAAPVGQRGRAVAAEQGRQPAGQIAADHVAIGGIGRPARDEMRQDRGASGKAALQGVLEIEQAEIILTPLAGHDAAAALGGIRNQP